MVDAKDRTGSMSLLPSEGGQEKPDHGSCGALEPWGQEQEGKYRSCLQGMQQ